MAIWRRHLFVVFATDGHDGDTAAGAGDDLQGFFDRVIIRFVD
jgi:hypothetical protein